SECPLTHEKKRTKPDTPDTPPTGFPTGPTETKPLTPFTLHDIKAYPDPRRIATPEAGLTGPRPPEGAGLLTPTLHGEKGWGEGLGEPRRTPSPQLPRRSGEEDARPLPAVDGGPGDHVGQAVAVDVHPLDLNASREGPEGEEAPPQRPVHHDVHPRPPL